MPDEGYVVADGPHGRTMLVTGAWSSRAASELAQGDIETLQLNYAQGFRERTLDFLEPWPIRRLQLLARTITNVEPIYRLAGSLEDLSLACAPTTRIDLAVLPRLHSIWAENWRQVRDTVSRAGQLRRLGVHGYAEEDLIPLAGNGELRSVRLKQAPRLTSLLGVERLLLLEEMEVSGATRLTDLASLRGHLPRLRSLKFETCGGIASLVHLGQRSGLEELSVANCGPIDTLAPLREMQSLTRLYLYESTRVADGDLTPLLTPTVSRTSA